MKNMNEKIENAMLLEIRARGYAAPVDVLLDIGLLDRSLGYKEVSGLEKRQSPMFGSCLQHEST